MDKLNVVIVYSPEGDRLLMCRRVKPPFQGLLNFVGGKLEPGEDALEAAYRELAEETGIPRDAIRLRRLMDLRYHGWELELQVFFGRLTRPVALVEELNPLTWVDRSEDFFDGTRFAGDGNIGHMLAHIDRLRAQGLL